MALDPEILAAAVIAAIVFVVGALYLRARSRRTRSIGRQVGSGPTNLRFSCAGCGGEFTHSRRTMTAWRQGMRSFLCNACHTKKTRISAPPSP